MGKLFNTAALVIALAFPSLIFAAENCAPPTEPYTPRWEIGDIWTYKDLLKEEQFVTTEVVDSHDGNLVVAIERTGKPRYLSLYRPDGNLVESNLEKTDGKYRYDPVYPYVPITPIAVGAAYEARYVMTRPNATQDASLIVGKVVGYEALETPAGSICAFRLEDTLFLNGSATPHGRRSTWIAPAMHYRVKYQYWEGEKLRLSTALQSYSLAPNRSKPSTLR